MIVLDAAVVGYEVQDSVQEVSSAPVWLKFLSLVFKACFAVELVLRFLAFGVFNGLRDSPWLRFDAFLVGFAILEMFVLVSEGSGMVTLLKFCRVARLLRAFRFQAQFRTLCLLVTGLLSAVGTIMWTLVLIMLIAYIYGVVAVVFIYDRSDPIATERFDGLFNSMLTLFQFLTLDSIAAIYRPLILDASSLLQTSLVTVYVVSFVMLVSIALMNLVTAVMVESFLAQASNDREYLEEVEKERRLKILPELKAAFEAIDEDRSGEITLAEIQSASPETLTALTALAGSEDIEVIFRLLDEDGSGAIDLDEFLNGLVKISSGARLQQMQLARIMKTLAPEA